MTKQIAPAGFGLAIVLTLFINIFSVAPVRAQETFVPFPVSAKDSLNFARVTRRYQTEKDTIAFSAKAGRQFINEQCSLRSEYIKSAVENEMFLTGSAIDKYIQKIVSEIIGKNPVLKDRITVLVSRDPEPNAYALGNGFVIFNIGMLNQVKSEAEIAFILCHEFSHDVLQHGNKDIYATASRITDEAFIRELKQTMKEEYNTKKKVRDLLLPGLKNKRQYSRAMELQADSLGFVYLQNTAYADEGAINVMDVLDSIDISEDRYPLNLKTYFTLEKVPSKNSWFVYDGSSSLGGGFETEKDSLEDSLKTHPDCKVRKEKLMAIRKQAGGKQLFIQPESDFKKVKFETGGELVQQMLDWYNIDYTVLYSLFYLNDYPANSYSRAVLSLGLAFLAKEKRNLSSSKYMRNNGPDLSDNLNHVVAFLLEVSPDECGALSYWMLRPFNEDLKNSEVYLAALALSAYSNKANAEYEMYKAAYEVAFPKGRYQQFFPTPKTIK